MLAHFDQRAFFGHFVLASLILPLVCCVFSLLCLGFCLSSNTHVVFLPFAID